MTSRKVNFLKSFIVNRDDTYTVQGRDGIHTRIPEPLTEQILLRHVAGKITVGAYQLNKANNVKWFVFDLDPGQVPHPKETAKMLIKACLEKKRFPQNAVRLEASRYPDPSYHIWVFFFMPVPAKAAKWLGTKILTLENINQKEVELFPKQTKIGENGFGNCVKLPFGFHQEKRKWSRFLDPQTFQPLAEETMLDITPCVIEENTLKRIMRLTTPSNIQLTVSQKLYKNKSKVRPCIREALKTVLRGAQGHRMRLAIAAEYLTTKTTVNEICDLFKAQNDFNAQKTRIQVEHAAKTGYKPFKCATIKELGYCLGMTCPIFRKRRKEFLEKVEDL